jgi:hypothetical protein
MPLTLRSDDSSPRTTDRANFTTVGRKGNLDSGRVPTARVEFVGRLVYQADSGGTDSDDVGVEPPLPAGQHGGMDAMLLTETRDKRVEDKAGRRGPPLIEEAPPALLGHGWASDRVHRLSSVSFVLFQMKQTILTDSLERDHR